jgi:hypothetical protein
VFWLSHIPCETCGKRFHLGSWTPTPDPLASLTSSSPVVRIPFPIFFIYNGIIMLIIKILRYVLLVKLETQFCSSVVVNQIGSMPKLQHLLILSSQEIYIFFYLFQISCHLYYFKILFCCQKDMFLHRYRPKDHTFQALRMKLF